MKMTFLPGSFNVQLKKCTLFITAFISSGIAIAQHNANIPQYGYYENSTVEYKVPFANTDTLFQRAQLLYRPANLLKMNSSTLAPSGTISRVYLRTKPGTSKVFNMENVIIFLGQTTDTNFKGLSPTSPDVPFYPASIMTKVFNAAKYTISSPGWIEFELNPPFAYDKNKSLIVEISGDKGFNTTAVGAAQRSNYGTFASPTGAYGFTLQEFGFDIGANTSGVANVEANSAIEVYPNPAREQARLIANEDMNGTLVLTDLNGRVLLKEQVAGRQHIFSVASIANGLYFYKVINTDNVMLANGKLTVAR